MKTSPYAQNEYAAHAEFVTKFGGNLAIAATETIWSVGGLYVWPDTIELVSVVSDDADDTIAGAGARTVTISGLDADFNSQSETVEMNGLGVVDTTKTFSRVFRAFVNEAGVYSGANEGTITITHKVSTDTLCEIPATKSQSKLGLYTVPAGFTAFMMSVHASVSVSNNGVTFELFKRENADSMTDTFRPFRLVSTFTDLNAAVDFQYPIGVAFAEKTDLEWRGTKVGVAADPSAEIEFSLVLCPNNK
jgi:hypothetical protein